MILWDKNVIILLLHYVIMLHRSTGQQYIIPDDTKPIAGVRGNIGRRTTDIIINPLTSTPSSFLYGAGTEKIYNNNNNNNLTSQRRPVCLLYLCIKYPCIVIFVVTLYRLHIPHTYHTQARVSGRFKRWFLKNRLMVVSTCYEWWGGTQLYASIFPRTYIIY